MLIRMKIENYWFDQSTFRLLQPRLLKEISFAKLKWMTSTRTNVKHVSNQRPKCQKPSLKIRQNTNKITLHFLNFSFEHQVQCRVDSLILMTWQKYISRFQRHLVAQNLVVLDLENHHLLQKTGLENPIKVQTIHYSDHQGHPHHLDENFKTNQLLDNAKEEKRCILSQNKCYKSWTKI